MNTRLCRFVGAVLAVSAVSSAALADMVDMRFVGTGAGRTVRVTNGSSTSNVFAGQLRQFFSNGTGLGASLQGELLTYCTDLTQSVSSSTLHYNVSPVGQAPVGSAMGDDKARAIASLYDYALGTQLTSSTTNDMACAFQLAVWEIVADYNTSLGASSLSLSSGTFRATQTNGSALWSSVTTLLNGFIQHTNNSSFDVSSIAAITHSSKQDQLVTVPAPGVAALAGMGMTLIASRRRNRKA